MNSQKMSLVRICSIDGCKSKHSGKGFCEQHYRKYKKYGNPLHIFEHIVRLCSINGCNNKHKGKDFCEKHLDRLKKHGNAEYQRLPKVCSINGCNNKHKGKSFCDKHLAKFREHNDPLYVADPKETSRKLSEAGRGRKQSEAEIKKRSISMTGKKFSDEHKRNLSKALKGKRLGTKLSESTRQKMIIAQNKPEKKEIVRKTLRKNRHNQQKPNLQELKIKKILMNAKVDFKMFVNVPYNLKKELRQHEADFLILPNKIIEHNGKYAHADPRLYSSNKKIYDKIAGDIWKKEKIMLKQIRKEGYRILVVWELDLKKDIEKTTKKILKFAKS